MGMLAGAVERERSPFFTGVLFGVAQMGVVVGPLVGGVLTERVGWRWCEYWFFFDIWVRRC
ncbi:MFS transporter [Pyrenophora seminiperda CCB06]|uniref:MFS transporter n=1 Tax=Pyrenophora seminiperda CCB06 TaxID=1302712 RepID=A0A3M7MDQ6_9PLEO|nr:MFS transporter [Pyrenophora seminiperda CCB06]